MGGISDFTSAIERAEAALAGGSNDAEHDALFGLVEHARGLEAALVAPVRDIIDMLDGRGAFPPVALYDQEATG